MKFSSFSLLALGLSGAIAAPTDVVKRAGGIDSLLQAFDQITHAVNSVQSAVSSYNGGIPAQIASTSAQVIKSTKSAIQVAHSAGQLSQSDALKLTAPVQGIIQTTQKIVDELDSKEAQIAAAGACQATLSSLEQQKSASNELTQAISTQLPKSLQALSAKLSGQIVVALDKAIKTYQSCQNTGSSGGSGGSTATATVATMTAAMPSSSGSSAPSGGTATATAAPAPHSTASASGSASSPSSSPGAASKGQISYGLGAVAAVLAMVV